MTEQIEREPADGAAAASQKSGSVTAQRTLLVLGVTAVAAVIVFAFVRRSLVRRPVDPTTERIQSLIDEANQLLKQLDDKQRS
ncbi:MAG: hypothetical protein ACREM8_09735 [Vulcanimicrobiaceae bacterium]